MTARSRKAARKTVSPEQRKRDILDAALTVFKERGYAATRIEDIARRAGVAKGTVYLHFADKETLFTSLISGVVSPVLERIETVSADEDVSARVAVAMLYHLVDHHILKTDRLHLVRLIISEGPLFPAIAEFYHREVISVGLGVLRRLLKRAAERGELRSNAVADTPQIVIAPVLTSIIWGSLFQRQEPLDTNRLFDGFLDTLFMSPDTTPHPQEGLQEQEGEPRCGVR